MAALPTDFAPAERASADELAAARSEAAAAGLIHHVTNAIPCAMTVLDEHRQIIYCNRHLLRILGMTSVDEILGQRPGEAFRCVHSCETRGGCGTTLFCSQCGAVRAILTAQIDNITTVQECRIRTTSGKAFEFRVWATPYASDHHRYTVFSLVDIRDEKRRQALERTFLHDASNTLSGIVAYSSLLNAEDRSERRSSLVHALQSACARLTEEFDSHRSLIHAESGSLSANRDSLSSLQVLSQLIERHSGSPEWADHTILLSEDAVDVPFRSDRVLLMRVLGNMLRNALEAASSQDTVTLSCTADASQLEFSVHNPGAIPHAVQLQIFQRYFSTKAPGRGIGTYAMKLLGERYLGGHVSFTSTANEGSVFRISLPRTPPTDRS